MIKPQVQYKTNKFYINGRWIAPEGSETIAVIDPSTEEVICDLAMGTSVDVEAAVKAAATAFHGWSTSSKVLRLKILRQIETGVQENIEEITQAISLEMGAPIDLARDGHALGALDVIKSFIKELEGFEFEKPLTGADGQHFIRYEAAGVCALITPWNWPLNQVALKVIAALAAGCTCVLKPSEIAPLSTILFTGIIAKTDLPVGVYNMVHGNGLNVGAVLSAHKDVDVVSITGSTRSGIEVMKTAAETVKRVSLELGGKSPSIVFSADDLDAVATKCLWQCMLNSGQTCSAPTRLLVHDDIYDEFLERITNAAKEIRVDVASKSGAHIGPVVSAVQYEKIQSMILAGIDDGATVIAGGPCRPEGLTQGYFVRPTVFANVHNDMRISREEIFGPVLCILRFSDEQEAVNIANDSPYGLAAYVTSSDVKQARRVAYQLRAGILRINGAAGATNAPFGGYKMSGIGREGGEWGFHEFLEVKSISGLKVE